MKTWLIITFELSADWKLTNWPVLHGATNKLIEKHEFRTFVRLHDTFRVHVRSILSFWACILNHNLLSMVLAKDLLLLFQSMSAERLLCSFCSPHFLQPHAYYTIGFFLSHIVQLPFLLFSSPPQISFEMVYSFSFTTIDCKIIIFERSFHLWQVCLIIRPQHLEQNNIVAPRILRPTCGSNEASGYRTEGVARMWWTYGKSGAIYMVV